MSVSVSSSPSPLSSQDKSPVETERESESDPFASSFSTSTPFATSSRVSPSPLTLPEASNLPSSTFQEPVRPKSRRRGQSESAAWSDTASGLFSYFPTLSTGYHLPNIQALDLDLPTVPSHLTYSSLRSSLLSHIGELERRLVTYVTIMGDVDAHHPEDEPSFFKTHSRTGSASSMISPEVLLHHVKFLREEALRLLPSLQHYSPLQLRDLTPLQQPSSTTANHVRQPLTSFLSSLPSRLDYLHASVPMLPSSSSFSSRLPDLSFSPTSPLGIGAQQVLTLLDSILPDDNHISQTDQDDESGLVFPAFPNRTSNRYRELEAIVSKGKLTRRGTTESVSRAESERAMSEKGRDDGEDDMDLDFEDEVILTKVEVIEVTVEMAVQRAAEAHNGLIGFDDLPILWQNNEFVLTGYRFIPIDQWPKLFKSLFTCHNETVNIHSHLTTSLLVLLCIPYVIFVSSPFTAIESASSSSFMDTAVLCFFLLAAFKCLFCSSIWHLFAGCATKRYFITFACVDYFGIAWLIAASVNTVVYFGFYCQPGPMVFYGLVTFGVGIAGSTLPFMQWFNERKNKGYRIAFFLAMALSALGPIAHMSLIHGLAQTGKFIKPLTPMIGSYLAGLWFYANHYPEVRWPGRFDFVGASHNIWHWFIVLAIYCHYVGVLELYRTKHQFACSAVQSSPFSANLPFGLKAAFGSDGLF
ncbi:Predicted membrane proteins, contain hemolysin III domain [Phaffia rhodozyma]|uniref:Predicted membrane proteins, contain hemolysin III domain n=1 Tax=Phaffia rhodozyma TaxID=264483 RepID=A0A0F7SNK6_PHARH|nr:Predicted membrane proteins, contain hemolysin III domain [Phaffia rhodozyma]